MNGQDQIRAKVIGIIADQALMDPAEVKGSDTLESLGIDSLGLVESIFAIEEEFDVPVPFNANEPNESDFDISSVDAIVAAVSRLVEDAGA